MKILDLPRKFPYPLRDGEAISVTYLSKALHNHGAEMVMLSVNQLKQPFDIRQLPKGYDHFREMHLVDIDNRVKPIPALLNLFTSKSYHIERFVSKDFERKLIELLEKESYDIVQIESLFLAPYAPIIRKHSKAKVIMRAHNVEHEIWERVTRNTPPGPKKWYLRLLTRRLKKYEIDHLNDYDAVLTVTQRDLDIYRQLGCTIPGIAVTVGLDMTGYKAKTDFSGPVRFGFIGTLDWMPNTEGLKWLIDESWPALRTQQPNAELHIAGRHAPAWLRESLPEGITYHGEVPDAHVFMNDNFVQIVPLLSGGGIRVKIIEAMALGCVVISTSVGIEGIDAVHQQHALIANTAEEFVACMNWCMENPDKLPAIAANASALVRADFDNQITGRKLHDFYKELILGNI